MACSMSKAGVRRVERTSKATGMSVEVAHVDGFCRRTRGGGNRQEKTKNAESGVMGGLENPQHQDLEWRLRKCL